MVELAAKRNKSVSFEPRNYVPTIEKKEFGREPVSLEDIPQTFVDKLGLEKKPVSEVKFLLKFIIFLASFYCWLQRF